MQIKRQVNRRSNHRSGFSLLELMVVVALIGIVTLMALPSVGGFFKVSLNSASREIASLVREAYNSSVMTGRVHRLVYDIKEGTYWVESGPSNILLETKETKEKEERRKRWQRDDEKKEPDSFQLEKTITRKKLSLPRGVEFEDIYTEQSHEPITTGIAYTHFFPQGLSEQSLIHLKDGSDHKFSLIISALVGRSTVSEGYIKESEAYAE